MAYITITNKEEVMTLREGISPSDMESEFFCATLVERLRWAAEDAHPASAAQPTESRGLSDTLIKAYPGRTRLRGAG
jgi:hypothetical protein